MTVVMMKKKQTNKQTNACNSKLEAPGCLRCLFCLPLLQRSRVPTTHGSLVRTTYIVAINVRIVYITMFCLNDYYIWDKVVHTAAVFLTSNRYFMCIWYEYKHTYAYLRDIPWWLWSFSQYFNGKLKLGIAQMRAREPKSVHTYSEIYIFHFSCSRDINPYIVRFLEESPAQYYQKLIFVGDFEAGALLSCDERL